MFYTDYNVIQNRFKKCLKELTDRLTHSSLSRFLIRNSGIQIYQILLHLIQKFQCQNYRIHEKIGVIYAILVVLQQLTGKDITFPATLRLCIHIITNSFKPNKLPLYSRNSNGDIDIRKFEHNDQTINTVVTIINLILQQTQL